MMKPEGMPILRPLPVRKRGERRRFELMAAWTFFLLGKWRVFHIPKGFIFDGASIPRLFWNMLSPTGYLFLAGLIHDYIYKNAFIWTYEVKPDGSQGALMREFFDQKSADQAFQDVADAVCMKEKVWTATAKITLRAFGKYTWNKYREEEKHAA